MKNIFFSFAIGIISSIVIFGLFGVFTWSIPYLKQNHWDNPKLIFGHHFHHSLLGLIAVLYGLYIINARKYGKSCFWIGFGLGIIIIHTIEDGHLLFIN